MRRPVAEAAASKLLVDTGWNCRCTVVQVLKGKYQETDHNPYTISRCKNCPKAQGNLASGVPDNQLCEACGIVRGHSNKEDNYYADQKYGNRLKISQSADISELPLNVDAARDLLSSFPEYSVKILAHSTEKGVKNPEYLINDLIADRKGIEGYNGIISGFKKAIKQGCQAVYIDMDAHMSSEPLREILLSIKLEGRRKDFQTGIIQKCFIRHNGKVVEIGSDYFEGTQDEIRAGIRDVLQKLKR